MVKMKLCGLCSHFDMDSFGMYKKEYGFCKEKRKWVAWHEEACERFCEW